MTKYQQSIISSTTCSEESYTFSSHSETISSDSDIHKEQKSLVLNKGFNITSRKFVIIGLIVLLIVIIITMVVIRFTVLNLDQQLQKSSTSISNSYSSTTAGTNTPIIYDVGNGGASGDPPCSSYTVVNDPLRNIGTSGIGGTCDTGSFFNTSIGGRWIRFIGTGGTIIPLTSPGINHCGAFLTGWFNGTLPSTTGTTVTEDICFDLSDIVCGYHVPAPVVNCGSFYVYFLPPLPLCNARYCTI